MKYLLYICLATVMLTITSCKKFLEETSPSILIPTEAEHFEELLYGEGYPNYSSLGDIGYSKFSELVTDNVEWGHLTNINPILGEPKDYDTKEGWGVYLFLDDPESGGGNGLDSYWGALYKSINVCNVVLNGLDKTPDSQADLKRKVKGQAYALRALSYLSLMNIYGAAYDKEQDSEYGVPIKTSSEAEDRTYRRNSVHEVYNLMKSDVDMAISLLDPAATIKLYEMNWYAAMILATRIHLYMENYDEVTRLGEIYLSRKSEMPVSTQVLTNGNFMGFTASWSGVSMNPEVVFNYGSSPATYNSVYQGSTVADFFTISAGLRSLFSKSLKPGQSDQRMTNPSGVTASWFFGAASSRYVPRKIHSLNTRRNTLRTGEVLMNLAEAYTIKGDIPRALSNLNTLRASRIRSYTNLSVSEFTPEEFKTFMEEERRRELCFEDHRLADLKRAGMPGMVRVIEDKTGKYRVTIPDGDMGYIFQIPLKERELNVEIQRIPRPVRTIEPF